MISGIFRGGKKEQRLVDSEEEDDGSGGEGAEEYVPRPSTSRAGRKRKSPAQPPAPKAPKVRKSQNAKKKAKGKDAAKEEKEFDHTVFLKSKVVTEKSTISDMVIDAIVKNRTRAQPAVIYREAELMFSWVGNYLSTSGYCKLAILQISLGFSVPKPTPVLRQQNQASPGRQVQQAQPARAEKGGGGARGVRLHREHRARLRRRGTLPAQRGLRELRHEGQVPRRQGPGQKGE